MKTLTDLVKDAIFMVLYGHPPKLKVKIMMLN